MWLTCNTALCHLDNLAKDVISSGGVTANSLCYLDDIIMLRLLNDRDEIASISNLLTVGPQCCRKRNVQRNVTLKLMHVHLKILCHGRGRVVSKLCSVCCYKHSVEFIAQIAPMTFQTSIPHRPAIGCARCSGHWVSGYQHVCSSYSQEDIKRQLTKTSNGRCFQLYQYLSHKPHLNFKPTGFCNDFVCVLQMPFLT